MTDWVQHAKDAFFLTGSVAGLFAFLRPVVESKHQRDIDRANVLLGKFNEDEVMALDSCTYVSRRVPEAFLLPFDEIKHKLAENRQEVRFTGPLKRYLRAELEGVISAYDSYRAFVQVPEWEPRDIDGSGHCTWFFNKEAFRDGVIISEEYAKHLEAAAVAADLLRMRFQRFQSLTELHFYEAIASRFFVPRRFRSAKLVVLQ